ncbi:LLM class F420-dependent oxidoreductase [Kribbella pittospori]|uniref:LLM class F420-dependent oxidoreductase n=1 Tax=Kribbella pittospori TaxID=722689 RepID=A0A4R0JJ29_9ACTN|nr:LLM class F420-dependent oxidoreductase [Kribbella pittospori]TCC46267.1 LLM class F420-dependent oxidoreductase [Kribbella pittospori]
MRPVRIGAQLAPQRAEYAAIRRAAAEVEDLGADILFTWDHFFPLGKVAEGKHFEGWTILAAWAEQTSRIDLGVLVSCNSYRNPDLLADMARTVDHISGGRVVFGIGAGFKEREFLEYGYEFPSPGRRVAELAEALPRIEKRLAALNPPPIGRMPILIAGGGEQKMLRVVARHADIWNTFAEGEDLVRKLGLLDRYCAEIGRDPATIERSVHVGGDPWQVGPPLRELGVTLFTVSTSGPDYNLDTIRQWIAWRNEQNS